MHGTFVAAGPGIEGRAEDGFPSSKRHDDDDDDDDNHHNRGRVIRGLEAVDVAPTLSFLLRHPRPDERERQDPLRVAERRRPLTEIQLLGFNDFHGNLEPPSGSGGRIGATNAGGVEFFASHIKRLRATNPKTLTVSAGDLIGATPLISALFHDEPTIEAANLLGPRLQRRRQPRVRRG